MIVSSNNQINQQIKYRLEMHQYPYRDIYERKFLGKQSNLNRLYEMKNIIMNNQSEKKLKQLNMRSPSLMPKVKQLIKINKYSMKKMKGKSDKISPLEIYLNKRLLNKQKDSKMLKKHMPENHIKDTDFNQTFQEFLTEKKQTKHNSETLNGLVFMFLEKLEQNNDLHNRRNEIQEIAQNIIQKQRLKDDEENHLEQAPLKKKVNRKSKSVVNLQNKTINWVLTECSKYQTQSARKIFKHKSLKPIKKTKYFLN